MTLLVLFASVLFASVLFASVLFASGSRRIQKSDFRFEYIIIEQTKQNTIYDYVSPPASDAIFSKVSLMKEFMMDMDFLEMPVSGWTCSGVGNCAEGVRDELRSIVKPLSLVIIEEMNSH